MLVLIRQASQRMNISQKFPCLTNIGCHKTIKNWSVAPSIINGRNQGETFEHSSKTKNGLNKCFSTVEGCSLDFIDNREIDIEMKFQILVGFLGDVDIFTIRSDQTSTISCFNNHFRGMREHLNLYCMTCASSLMELMAG